MTDALRLAISGLKVERVDGATLEVQRGSCWGLDGVAFETATEISLPVTGFRNGMEVYVWLIRGANGVGKGVLNSARFQKDVPLGTGEKLIRKLPWGAIFNSAWGGMAAMHVSHWPLPEITYTDSQDNATWQACTNLDTDDQWQGVDLSRWLPDNARMALLVPETTMRSGGTRAGSTFWRSTGAQANGEKLGSANPSFGIVGGERTIRVNSDHVLYVKTTGDAALTLRVKGYQQTESS